MDDNYERVYRELCSNEQAKKDFLASLPPHKLVSWGTISINGDGKMESHSMPIEDAPDNAKDLLWYNECSKKAIKLVN